MPQLSVIIPVYNEAGTIGQILEKVNGIAIDKEIIVVDDGSSDGTDRILRGLHYQALKIIHHTRNRGKGAAFLTALANASGEFVIIQDADLEYDPSEYLKLIEEIKKDNIALVLGVRFREGYRGLLIPKLGNRFLAGLLNILFGAQINDFLTCYKLMRSSTFIELGLKAQGFGIDAEIVIKALKKGLKIEQVPITYRPRSYKEGKKIKLIDGLRYIVNIIKYRFSN